MVLKFDFICGKVPREVAKEGRKKVKFPVSGSEALKIACEDLETSHFMKSYFSFPEQKSKIFSSKWISRYHSGFKWNVEIIEKALLPTLKENEMINIAFIEVDSYSGKIINRQYYRSLLLDEYRMIKNSKHLVKNNDQEAGKSKP